MTTTTPDPKPTRDHLLSDFWYQVIKAMVMIMLPAAGALYFGLAQIWGFPGGEQVVGSIVVVDTFLGVVIKVGEASYDRSEAKFAGAINVAQQPEKMVFSLDLNGQPEDLLEKKTVHFKVNRPSTPAPARLTPSASMPPTRNTPS